MINKRKKIIPLLLVAIFIGATFIQADNLPLSILLSDPNDIHVSPLPYDVDELARKNLESMDQNTKAKLDDLFNSLADIGNRVQILKGGPHDCDNLPPDAIIEEIEELSLLLPNLNIGRGEFSIGKLTEQMAIVYDVKYFGIPAANPNEPIVSN